MGSCLDGDLYPRGPSSASAGGPQAGSALGAKISEGLDVAQLLPARAAAETAEQLWASQGQTQMKGFAKGKVKVKEAPAVEAPPSPKRSKTEEGAPSQDS